MAVLRETIIDVTQAAARFPGADAQRVRRWIRSGVNGIRLDAVRLGGKWITSEEALGRFLAKLNPQQAPTAA